MKQDLSKINLKPRMLEEACEVIGQLVEIIVDLKKDNDFLREQLKVNSKNSSFPPSQDRKKKKPEKAKSNLKKGAQKGHKGNQQPVTSLWLFFEKPGVSPIKNYAERPLRLLVISKKLTFGTQLDRGSRYIERIFSTIATCKQQGRDVLAFVIQAVQQYFRKEQPIFLSAIS